MLGHAAAETKLWQLASNMFQQRTIHDAKEERHDFIDVHHQTQVDLRKTVLNQSTQARDARQGGPTSQSRSLRRGPPYFDRLFGSWLKRTEAQKRGASKKTTGRDWREETCKGTQPGWPVVGRMGLNVQLCECVLD